MLFAALTNQAPVPGVRVGGSTDGRGVLLVSGCDCSSNEKEEETTVPGGLFSVIGNWSNPGLAGRAAMEIAVGDVDQTLGDDVGLRCVAVIEDTRLEPE